MKGKKTLFQLVFLVISKKQKKILAFLFLIYPCCGKLLKIT